MQVSVKSMPALYHSEAILIQGYIEQVYNTFNTRLDVTYLVIFLLKPIWKISN